MSDGLRTQEGRWRVVTLYVTVTTQETADYHARSLAEYLIARPDSEVAAVEVEVAHEVEVGTL